MEIRYVPLALRIASLFEVMSSRGMSPMLSMEWAAGKGKVTCNGGWLITLLFCDGFFDSASVFTKSVAEMTFSLAYILNVAFITQYHIDEIGGRAGDVMSYASFFVGREKSVRCGSLCDKRTRLVPISVTTERSRSRGGFPAVFGPDQYVTQVFATAV